jgi:DNA-3-methyladenine glycosylase II
MQIFEYGQREVNWLKSKDKKLGAVMERIGPIRREVIPDLYISLIQHIVSQQISGKAARTIWRRMREAFGDITPASLHRAGESEIQQCGMSMRKALYIKDVTRQVLEGECDLPGLYELPDDEVCVRLSAFKGIGVWTAEMLMLFAMQRPDVLSWDDAAIIRGLRMLHRHRRISRALFEKYKKRYSPYGSVASLYLWAIAGGACPELDDPAPLSEAQKKKRAVARRKKRTETV